MRVNLLGVQVDNVDFRDAAEQSGRLLLIGRHAYIVTPNPEIVVAAQGNTEFREVLNRADLSVPDGMGLIWASRVLGSPLQERVAGADLAEALVAQAAEAGKSVFFLGAAPGVAEAAAEAMKEKYSGLRVSGTWSGSAGPEGDEAALARLGKDPLGLLLVAYGHPKQEFWIGRNLEHLNINLTMAVGGTFDYWGGRVSRAPRPLRRAGLEWLYRLFRQPWRLRRQLTLLKFIWLIFKAKLSDKSGS